MENDNITIDELADALINLNENSGLCDHGTAIGFKTSKKKNILKSSEERSFSKFNNAIRKKQAKKD